MHIGYWWENQKEINQYEDQDVGGWVDDIKMGSSRERMVWYGLD
jgi:hypothetical protein